ncbi:MAG TPA: hypothetical protein DCR04_08100 [Flavobacteriales bacterium]|nr:hypothetical protein [Flavobacteriales bacterium]
MRLFPLLLALLFALPSFATDPVTDPEPPAFLVSYTLVKSHTKKTINALWKKNKVPKIALPVKLGVDIYEIIYKVKWIDGTWRNASGIYYVPKTEKPVPYMMYGHGTQIHKGRKIHDGDSQQFICLAHATDGYATMFPDYYGIGKGEGQHLYQHAWSEAHSFIYMLKAIDELNKELNVVHSSQLFLTGYSQGGHASFAAHKYIEELNDPRFQVTASSPMSGAYDMTGVQEDYMFEEYPRPFYLPYLLLSYQTAYNIIETENPYEVFKAPFDTLFPGFFENNDRKTLDELNKHLPKIPSQVVEQKFLDEYATDPNHPFRVRLRENNLVDWSPKAPVQLCYCKGDKEVNYKNSEVAYTQMKAAGVEDIVLNNLSDNLDHNTCAGFAVLATKAYFDRFKKKGKNPKMKEMTPFKKWVRNIVKRKVEKEFKEAGKDKSYL